MEKQLSVSLGSENWDPAPGLAPVLPLSQPLFTLWGPVSWAGSDFTPVPVITGEKAHSRDIQMPVELNQDHLGALRLLSEPPFSSVTRGERP